MPLSQGCQELCGQGQQLGGATHRFSNSLIPFPYLTLPGSLTPPASTPCPPRSCQGFGGTFNLSVSLGSSGKPSTVEWTPRPGTAVHPPTHHDPQLSDLGQGQGIPNTSPPLGHSEGHNQHSLLSVGCDGDQTHRGMNVTVAGPDTASGEWDGGHNPPRLPPSRPPKTAQPEPDPGLLPLEEGWCLGYLQTQAGFGGINPGGLWTGITSLGLGS